MAWVLAAGLACAASGATYTVTSYSQLQTQINSAVAGDTIIVANGTYSADSTLTINRTGTAAAPIVIAAETIGGVEIRGSRGISFSSPAAYITLKGFKLTHASSISIPSGTKFIRLTRNIIELTIPKGSDVSYLNISGDDVEIDHNELRNKSTLGEMLDIAGSGSQVARRLWVHHNYFHDFTSPGGNGAETIRWGLSGLSLSTGNGLCEYNLFVRCEGENEMISNKSSGNTYRYNTVLDCVGGEISQRHGDNCLYYGNFMRNTQGIRVYGDSHLIFSNYLEGNSNGINMGNGDGDVHAGDALTSHDRPDNNVVVFNTLINNASQYEMGGRTGGLGATNTTFANNIIVGGSTAVSISSTAPYTNPVWSGNIIWNAANVGNIPSSGYVSVDPLLVADSNGVYHLRIGSPAIDAAIGNYPGVTVDQDGQPRNDPKDTGADEFSAGATVARILTVADVGPSAPDVIATAAAITGPASQTVATGDLAVFRVTVTGATPTYQWQFNGKPIAGATSPLYAVRAAPDTAGAYACAITLGSETTTPVATLAVVTTTDVGHLSNLSIRSNAGGNSGTLVVGAVIGGTDGNGGLPTLLRASGPSLAQFGVPGYVADPRLTLMAGATTLVASNDNWNGDSEIMNTSARVGAFGFTSNMSLDAALFRPALARGNYSMQVTSGTGAEGVALAELYDANSNFSPASLRLINVSALTQVGTGDNILIAGFTIAGSTGKTVLIRAVGPSLAPFGVTDAITDPKLQLFTGRTLLDSNDNWGGDATLAATFSAVGAFDLSTTSKDAALLITLPPGSYSVQVSGVGDLTGSGMVEVYEAK
jgi:hypothetical protein